MTQISEIRRVLGAAALLAALVLLASGAAQAKKKPKALTPPPAELSAHVNYLARKLYYLPLDESEPITSEIQKLVLDHLQTWIADRAPTDVELRRELEAAFSKLHYPLFANPKVFTASWNGGLVIGAGYTLGWSDYDRTNVVALFENREGKTRLSAVTNFIPRADLHYSVLSAPDTEDFRFIIYGTRLGKSQLRLTAMLYSFDGHSLIQLWEARDLYDGRMEVGKEKVTFRYLKEEEYVREQVYKRKPPRHEAIYKITPQGLTLEAEREIPF